MPERCFKSDHCWLKRSRVTPSQLAVHTVAHRRGTVAGDGWPSNSELLPWIRMVLAVKEPTDGVDKAIEVAASYKVSTEQTTQDLNAHCTIACHHIAALSSQTRAHRKPSSQKQPIRRRTTPPIHFASTRRLQVVSPAARSHPTNAR